MLAWLVGQNRGCRQKKIVGDNITAEKGAFTFSMDKRGKEIKEVPFVYQPNLIATVSDYVEKHK